MSMIKGALDDDRILGGVITLLMLAVVGLVIGIVLWSSNAELRPIATVEETESVEASPTPDFEGLADEDAPGAVRAYGSLTF